MVYKLKTFKTIWKRNYNSFSLDAFRNELAALNWDHVYDHNTDINVNFNYFFKVFNKTLDKHAPLKKIGKNAAKLCLIPWVTKGLRKSMKIRD